MADAIQTASSVIEEPATVQPMATIARFAGGCDSPTVPDLGKEAGPRQGSRGHEALDVVLNSGGFAALQTSSKPSLTSEHSTESSGCRTAPSVGSHRRSATARGGAPTRRASAQTKSSRRCRSAAPPGSTWLSLPRIPLLRWNSGLTRPLYQLSERHGTTLGWLPQRRRYFSNQSSMRRCTSKASCLECR